MKDARRSQTATAVGCVFHKGDEVYLAKGCYQGTVGTFIHLRTDPMWADILEPDLTVRVE
jgi:hypothetical protein